MLSHRRRRASIHGICATASLNSVLPKHPNRMSHLHSPALAPGASVRSNLLLTRRLLRRDERPPRNDIITNMSLRAQVPGVICPKVTDHARCAFRERGRSSYSTNGPLCKDELFRQPLSKDTGGHCTLIQVITIRFLLILQLLPLQAIPLGHGCYESAWANFALRAGKRKEGAPPI